MDFCYSSDITGLAGQQDMVDFSSNQPLIVLGIRLVLIFVVLVKIILVDAFHQFLPIFLPMF